MKKDGKIEKSGGEIEKTEEYPLIEITEEEQQLTKNWDINIYNLVIEYINTAKKKNEFPNKSGLRLFIRRSGRVNFIEEAKNNRIIAQAMQILHDEGKEYLMQNGLKNNTNAHITKLILSSNFGMRESKDITSNGQQIQGNSIVFQKFSGIGRKEAQIEEKERKKLNDE